MNIQLAAPRPDPQRRYRISSDSVWPLRRSNGLTWAQSKDSGQAVEVVK